MAQSTDNAQDLYLGAGKVYIDRLDANRARTGERYVGTCSALSIATEDEVKDFYSSSDRSRALLKSANTRRTPNIKITMNEVSLENLAHAFMGTKNNFAQTTSSKANYVPPAARVKPGYYFPLEDPSGTHRRQVSAVTVTGPSSSPTYAATTDYVVDTVSGRIYVVPGGAITDGAALEVDFTWATITGSALPYIAGGDTSIIEGFVRFVGDPSAGPQLEVQIYIASLRPDGDLNLIGEDYGEIVIAGKVLADSTNHPGELYRVFKLA